MRSRAWIWLFSSNEKTIARSGGCRYNPTTSQFFHEGGVGRQLERPDPVGAQPMGLPDARNRGVMETGHTPMRAAARRRRRLCRAAHDGFFLGQGNTGRPERGRSARRAASPPASPIQPEGNGRARDADVTTNGRARVPRGRPEHNARALDHALGGRAGSDQRFEAPRSPRCSGRTRMGSGMSYDTTLSYRPFICGERP